MSYNLFLDDLRTPAHAYIYPKRDSEGKTMPSRSLANQTGIKDDDWIIVRSYDEFVFTLNSKGVPDNVSFDHDLHQEHIDHWFSHTKQHNEILYDNFKVKTGRDCAQYLVNFCHNTNTKISGINTFIHSANPIGQIQLQKYLYIPL